jgi:hypothetical protein
MAGRLHNDIIIPLKIKALKSSTRFNILQKAIDRYEVETRHRQDGNREYYRQKLTKSPLAELQ